MTAPPHRPPSKRYAIRSAILRELQQQAEEGKPGPYVDPEVAGGVLVDGIVDLDALVRAVERALAKGA